MALVSSSLIIRSISLFNVIFAYFLLTSPSIIRSHGSVSIISMAMGLPHKSPSLNTPSAASSLCAAVLAYYSCTDFVAASMAAEVASHYWSSQAPIRLIMFFALVAYSYTGRLGGPWASREESLALGPAGPGVESLSNGVIFTWAFMEMIVWFWVFVTLRDERREIVARAFEKRKAEGKDH